MPKPAAQPGHVICAGLIGVALAACATVARAEPAGAASPPDATAAPAEQNAPAEPGFLGKATRYGVPVNSFLVDPALAVTEGYDDNVFATPRDPVADFLTIVSPSLKVRSNWKRHELRFESGADIGRYRERHGENYEDYHFGGDGRYDFSADSNLFGGASFSHLHEPRESPDNEIGTVPTTYDDIQSHLGFFQKLGRFFGRGGATFQDLDYDNVPSATGTINNDVRDRKIYELGARAGYEFMPSYQVFVQGGHNWRNYGAAEDNFGFQHDSSGNFAAVGLGYDGPGPLKGEFFVGYLNQDYTDPRFGDVSAPDFGGRMTYRVTDATKLTASVDRSVEETIVTGASSYLDTLLNVRVDHEIRPDLLGDVFAAYANEDFQGISRVDHVATIGTGVKYFLTPQVYIGADYQFSRRDSNDPDVKYDDNQIFVHLGGQLARGYNPEARPYPQDGGFYLGYQGGHGNVHTSLQGPRGMGGTLDTEFGGFGFDNGLFAGYGTIIDRMFLGLEIEADQSSENWHHARTPGGRIFSVGTRNSFGATSRLGYVLDQGSLVYGRLGAAWTAFDTEYQTPSGMMFPNSDRQTGIRIGGGVETPVSDRIFLRLDYTHTDYGDYDVTIPSGTDNFDNSEELVRAGIAYRFFDQTTGNQNGNTVPASDYDGPYAGVQVGWGAIGSLNQGPREGGSNFIANRGGDGPAGGIFGGYGMTWHRVYLGIDLDAGADGQAIGMERDPTGRTYSVEKVASFGASGRIGYVLDPGALVYGRVGPVLSMFNTKYELDPNSVNQANTMLGLRVGGGIEVPASECTFLRFDYAYSTYGTYDVNYTSGVDSFQNEDSLFQIGAGYRF